MTVEKAKFEYLQDLPFANGRVEAMGRITEPLKFRLEKDDLKVVTLFPVHQASNVPKNLLIVLQKEFNYVIEEGITYPHHQIMDFEDFVQYWFSEFVAVLLEGEWDTLGEKDLPESYWKSVFLGNFYVKPNYIGRCSHVCNAGFIVNHNKRGLGIGKELGSKYLDWAPRLGYIYSVFNLVFETNVASLKIWDSLGFERIGYVKNVAILKGYNYFVGAHMYGKDLV